MKTSIILGVLGALVAAPAIAWAQSAEPAPLRVDECVTVRRGDRNVTVCGVIDVPGDVPRPFSFGLTGRSPLGYTAVDPRRSFVNDVTAVVRRSPF